MATSVQADWAETQPLVPFVQLLQVKHRHKDRFVAASRQFADPDDAWTLADSQVPLRDDVLSFCAINEFEEVLGGLALCHTGTDYPEFCNAFVDERYRGKSLIRDMACILLGLQTVAIGAKQSYWALSPRTPAKIVSENRFPVPSVERSFKALAFHPCESIPKELMLRWGGRLECYKAWRLAPVDLDRALEAALNCRKVRHRHDLQIMYDRGQLDDERYASDLRRILQAPRS